MPIKFANTPWPKCFTWNLWMLYAALVRLALVCHGLRLCWRIHMFQVLKIVFFFLLIRKKTKKLALTELDSLKKKFTSKLILNLSTEYNSVFSTVAALNGCSWNPEKVCPPSSSVVCVNIILDSKYTGPWLGHSLGTGDLYKYSVEYPQVDNWRDVKTLNR